MPEYNPNNYCLSIPKIGKSLTINQLAALQQLPADLQKQFNIEIPPLNSDLELNPEQRANIMDGVSRELLEYVDEIKRTATDRLENCICQFKDVLGMQDDASDADSSIESLGSEHDNIDLEENRENEDHNIEIADSTIAAENGNSTVVTENVDNPVIAENDISHEPSYISHDHGMDDNVVADTTIQQTSDNVEDVKMQAVGSEHTHVTYAADEAISIEMPQEHNHADDNDQQGSSKSSSLTATSM